MRDWPQGLLHVAQDAGAWGAGGFIGLCRHDVAHEQSSLCGGDLDRELFRPRGQGPCYPASARRRCVGLSTTLPNLPLFAVTATPLRRCSASTVNGYRVFIFPAA